MATIWDVLLGGTLADVHLWSLPNIKGQGRERWIASRDRLRLERQAKKYDSEGHGVFFCVACIEPGEPRKKEHARELRFLFCDVDFKDIDIPPEGIELVLRDGLSCPPTRMHHTGNGIHCFWLLDVPVGPEGMEAAEILLRQLANHLGGDPTVAHRVALLRVPGTHNSKRGAWTEVRVIREGAEIYTLDQISAWLGSARDPAIVRRNREANPFLRTANEQGYRPPVDVEQRLRDMVVGGAGDTAVHNTQLSCTASLVTAGWEVQEITELVLGATQDLEGTDGWNWENERRKIGAMCDDWLKKHPRSATVHDITAALTPLVNAAAQSQVVPRELPGNVSLLDARKNREGKPGAKGDDPLDDLPERLSKKKKNEHVVLGMGVLASLRQHDGALMYADRQCWIYGDGLWRAMDEKEEKTWASVEVEQGCRAIGLVSNTKLVNETCAWLRREPALHKKSVPWDGHGMIATRGGMIDWKNGCATRSPTHADYATWRIDCDYVPAAECPRWEDMLHDDYEFDDGAIDFLQELLGASLIARRPRALRRALVLLGPSNTGKSNILNVMAGLISDQTNPTPLATLERSAHGTMPFIHPAPWVLHEAFEQSRWEMSATAKALLSGDQISINLKGGLIVPHTFTQPVFWGTNVPPQFKEASRAMENRLAIVPMQRIFDPMRTIGTAEVARAQGHNNPAELVLATERSGLLNWAIEGLKRVWARGSFAFTPEMQTALHAMRAESNMTVQFMEDWAEYDVDAYIRTADLHCAFEAWWLENRGGPIPTVEAFAKQLAALADPRLITGERVQRKRVVVGVRLCAEGLAQYTNRFEALGSHQSGTPSHLTLPDGEVNRVLSAEQRRRLGE